MDKLSRTVGACWELWYDRMKDITINSSCVGRNVIKLRKWLYGNDAIIPLSVLDFKAGLKAVIGPNDRLFQLVNVFTHWFVLLRISGKFHLTFSFEHVRTLLKKLYLGWRRCLNYAHNYITEVVFFCLKVNTFMSSLPWKVWHNENSISYRPKVKRHKEAKDKMKKPKLSYFRSSSFITRFKLISV